MRWISLSFRIIYPYRQKATAGLDKLVFDAGGSMEILSTLRIPRASMLRRTADDAAWLVVVVVVVRADPRSHPESVAKGLDDLAIACSETLDNSNPRWATEQ